MPTSRISFSVALHRSAWGVFQSAVDVERVSKERVRPYVHALAARRAQARVVTEARLRSVEIAALNEIRS
jgi:hypothetical protein